MLPLIRPDVSFAEVADDVEAILDSGILTSGEYVSRFEQMVAERVGVEHCVATTSATTALHLTLAALGVGPGDEVLVSDFTFPATGNVVIQCGARPVLVDCASDTMTMDVDHARSLITPRTKAMLPVDTFGQPAPLPELEHLATEFGIALVEDAACALGSAVDGVACGAFAVAGCFSFHPRKVVTTGEGGAVTTDDAHLAERLRLLRTHGGRRGPAVGLEFVEAGFNYRLAEIPAALGIAQLRRLDEILSDREATARHYDERLGPVVGVNVPYPASGEQWSYQSYVVKLDASLDRDTVVAEMRARGIETTLGTYAIHAHPAFAALGYRPGDLPRSWAAQQTTLTLPVVPRMTAEQADRVVAELVDAIALAAS